MKNKKRWEIQLEPQNKWDPTDHHYLDYRLIPQPEPLQEFVADHVRKLCELIANKEEEMIVAALPSDALARLKAIVDEEFESRLGKS